MSALRCRAKFWRLAGQAVEEGLLRPEVIHKIWDRKRKRGCWCHHVRTLQLLIRDVEEGRLYND